MTLLKANIVGVEEILAALTATPQDTDALTEHLVKTLKLSWETDQQTRYRLHWLEACGAIKASEAVWTLAK